MKTNLSKTIARVGFAAVLVSSGGALAGTAAGQGSGLAAARPEAPAFQCNSGTIKGTYGIQIEGTRPVPPCAGGGTETVTGTIVRTYDGVGNFTQIDNVKGSVTGTTPDRPGAGTYQVNANCTGLTQFAPAPGMVIEERMVIVRHGREIRAITTSPAPLMVTAVGEQIPIPAQVASRMLHNGTPFDIDLPLAGEPGIECRRSGATDDYHLVFTFNGPVTADSATVSDGAGTISSTSGNGTSTLTVDLTGVDNAQTTAVKLQGVSDGTSTADAEVAMSILVGDANGDGAVNSADAILTRNRSGQLTDTSNFYSDLNSDGAINSGDAQIVRTRSGTGLP